MKSILVTGSSGLVGTYLKREMPEANYVSSKDFNLLKENEVKKMFLKYKPDHVIHLAAKVGGIHHNIAEPVSYFEENILMNTLVVKESYLNNVKNFLGILSSCIYPDKIKRYPIEESQLFSGEPHKDLFSYSYAKRCMAMHIDAYNKKFMMKYNYIIPCNLYGEFDKFNEIEGHFVGALIKKIIEAKKNNKKYITLFGNGSPYRQFMHAKDLAKIIKEIVRKNISKSFNVATTENYTVNKIAKIALKACDAKDLYIKFDKTMPNGQMRKDVDISRMKKLFPNFQPTLLYDGIREIYKNKIK